MLETSAEERITSLSRLAEVLTVYRREGLRFACDGAGQGGSTPEALAALRPEFIKVDGRRTTAAARGAARGAIEATLGFARSTGAVTIAEGVENRISADRLRTLGVRCGQGFRLGRPAPIAAMPRPTSGAA